MSADRWTAGPIRFGVFEVDLRSGELRKQGVRIRLAEQPFAVLAMLLEQPGEVVTRDDLRRRLWSADTFVDFDQGLNKAINRVRETLGDSAESPRFIETLPKRGYRFIGTVTPSAPPAAAPAPTPTPTPPVVPAAVSRRVPYPPLVAAAAVVLVVAAALWWRRQPAPTAPVATPLVRSSLLPPPGTAFVPYSVALSRDGTRLAFAAETPEGARSLWVLPLSSKTAQPIPGTQGGTLPFWDPARLRLGFFADRRLKVVDLTGGDVRELADAPRPAGGTWSSTGTIVFAPDVNGPLFAVAATGGTPSAVTRMDAGIAGVQGHRWPAFVSDRAFVYIAAAGGAGVREDDLAVRRGGLDALDARPLAGLQARSVAVGGGRLFAARDGVLRAYPMDLAADRLGAPLVVRGADVAAPPTFFPSAFTVSGNGVLVFQSAGDRTSELTWLGADGREQGVLAAAHYMGPSFSPDGTRLAGSCEGPRAGTLAMCVYDLARGVSTRVSPGPSDRYAVWSPDGREIAYASGTAIQRVAADGSGRPQLVSTRGIPTDWTRDGRILSFGTHEGAVSMALSSTATHEVTELRPGAEGRLSPDGRWLAYLAPEGLVAVAYPAFTPRVPIAGPGMAQPRWGHDGRRLFYVAPDRKLMAVDFDPRTGKAGASRVVAQTRIIGTAFTMFQYDIAPDGRILVNATPRDPAPLTVLTGWADALP